MDPTPDHRQQELGIDRPLDLLGSGEHFDDIQYGRRGAGTLKRRSGNGSNTLSPLLGLAYWEQKPRDSNDRLASVLQRTGRPTKRADRTT